MDTERDLLLMSAARLYGLGVDLEMASDKLRCLVESGASYDSEEMREAYEAYIALDSQFKELETQYIKLRDSFLQ